MPAVPDVPDVPDTPDVLERVKQLIVDFDEAVDQRVDRVRGHQTVDRVMYGATEVGDWSLLWHLSAPAQALLPGRDPMTAVRLSAILGAESLLVNGAIKSLFNRHRPVWEEDRPRPAPHPPARSRAASRPATPAPRSRPPACSARAIRSGRSTTALAVVVSSSRVYVKMHHASDVIAGAAIGVGLAAVARRLWPKP